MCEQELDDHNKQVEELTGDEATEVNVVPKVIVNVPHGTLFPNTYLL